VGKLGIDPQQLGMQHNPVLYIFGSLLLTAIGIAVIRQVGKMSADSHPA
jgi:hypothetical protein